MDKDGRVSIFSHHCTFCGHCVISCPKSAIYFNREGIRYIQEGLAVTAREVLSFFKNRAVHINFLLDVTSLCDCWGFTVPAVVPDIGIMASRDIVAVDKASLDAVKVEDFIKGSLPGTLKLGKGKHLFEKVWGKDPYWQVRAATRLKMGSPKYDISEVT